MSEKVVGTCCPQCKSNKVKTVEVCGGNFGLWSNSAECTYCKWNGHIEDLVPEPTKEIHGNKSKAGTQATEDL